MTDDNISTIESRFEPLDQCPLCHAPESCFRKLTDSGDRFEAENAVLCSRCGLVFLTPRLTPASLAGYYASDQFSRDVRGAGRPTPAALAYRDMRARRRWALVQHRLPATGSCLEIGCGAGNFLRILQHHGYRVTGIDPSAGYAAYAREQGLNVVTGHFPDDLPVDADGSVARFDLIVMLHVLEHVPDPLQMLENVRSHLAPGGLVLIEYPDVELAARRRFLPPTYFERQHLFDFSADTLRAFLSLAGLEVREAVLEERVPPYDRNVLVFCSASADREAMSDGPNRAAFSRSREASTLERALRTRLRWSEPLMPLRPWWRWARALVARSRGGM